ncbi:hypothetical protein ACHWQZ_G001964 [Mnemiopsis leidyi]
MKVKIDDFLVTLLVLTAFSPILIETVNTCWKQTPSPDKVNCTASVAACEVQTCAGQDDVCYLATNTLSGFEARGCLGRDFCFGLINETWKRCETPTGTNETQCLYCCQINNCNADRVTKWPESISVSVSEEVNTTNRTFNVTDEKLPMIYIYAGAGGGTFLIILIILLVIYCVLETAKKRRLKEVIAAMNKRRQMRRERSLLERAGETVTETTGGIFSAIGGLFGFGDDSQDEKPMVEEPGKKKNKGSVRSTNTKPNIFRLSSDSPNMKFTPEVLDAQSEKYSTKVGSITALMPRNEAVKLLQEQDLTVYGDGKFPIEDYLAVITNKSDQVSFADYLQAVTMAMGDPMDSVIRENFVKLDKDRSGTLDQNELADMLDGCTNSTEKKNMVKELLDCMDVDKDGKVNYSEIVRAICFCDEEESV